MAGAASARSVVVPAASANRRGPPPTMAEAARAQPMQQGGWLALPEDITYDILVRLPPKSVVCCRAVCRSWRRLASDRGFLLAHHRRQPSLPLVYFILDDGRDPEVSESRLAVCDLRAEELQTVLRFSGHGSGWTVRDRERRLALHGSCDGVLLLSSDDHLFLCNPTTRYWCRLPPIHRDNTIAGLYSHRISGDYRVLYFRCNADGNCYNYVMEAGARKQRMVSRQVSPVHSSWRTWFARHTPPALLHDNLHWPLVSSSPESIAVFDTVAEVFRLMPSPPVNLNNQLVSNVKLLDMEGVLAMSISWSQSFRDDGPSRVDLWFLEDYKSNAWICKYRIDLPVEDISRFLGLLDLWTAVVVSHEGDVLVDLMNCLLGYDREGNSVANLPCDCSLLEIGPHMLKQSLLPHASLDKPPCL